MEPILQVQNLNYIYSIGTPFQHQALEDVSFSVYRGEFIGIIGHTGSGKSTLMQQLNGLLKPSSGKILLDGKDIWSDKKLTVRPGSGLVWFSSIRNISSLKKQFTRISPSDLKIWVCLPMKFTAGFVMPLPLWV